MKHKCTTMNEQKRYDCTGLYIGVYLHVNFPAWSKYKCLVTSLDNRVGWNIRVSIVIVLWSGCQFDYHGVFMWLDPSTMGPPYVVPDYQVSQHFFMGSIYHVAKVTFMTTNQTFSTVLFTKPFLILNLTFHSFI